MGGVSDKLVGGAELLDTGLASSVAGGGNGVGVDRVSAGVVRPNPCGEDEILPGHKVIRQSACWQLSSTQQSVHFVSPFSHPAVTM